METRSRITCEINSFENNEQLGTVLELIDATV